MQLLVGLLIPFLGTTMGSFTVFFFKRALNNNFQKFIIAFASGVMISASFWSLLAPAIEMSASQHFVWFPAGVGFLCGMLLLMFIDVITKKIKDKSKIIFGAKKNTMLMFAVTLHNIPEGMAVGVTFAGALLASSEITISSALALSFGIALQNFPEGAIISLPLSNSGMSKIKSFSRGVLSGIVEPISAVITILLTNLVVPALPYFLSFAAGAMIYVVVEELVPEYHEENSSPFVAIGTALGFVLMMILDIALS